MVNKFAGAGKRKKVFIVLRGELGNQFGLPKKIDKITKSTPIVSLFTSFLTLWQCKLSYLKLKLKCSMRDRKKNWFRCCLCFQPRLYKEATHLDQQKDPWNRLNMTPTLQSVRRMAAHHDPLAPRDALDFELKTSYDQHGDLFAPHNYSVIQRETLNLPHSWVTQFRIRC